MIQRAEPAILRSLCCMCDAEDNSLCHINGPYACSRPDVHYLCLVSVWRALRDGRGVHHIPARYVYELIEAIHAIFLSLFAQPLAHAILQYAAGLGKYVPYLVAREHIRSLSKAMINPPILLIIRSHLHRTSHHGREMVASVAQKVSKRVAISMWEVCDPSNSPAAGTARPIGNGEARTH